MQVRLAFSVAIKARGDVLVLDEVLAVGDEAFQRKCNDYFLERKKIRSDNYLGYSWYECRKKYCNKAVLIEDGLIKVSGNVDKVANQYSLDNLKRLKAAQEDSSEEVEEFVSDLKVNLLSPVQTTRNKVLNLKFLIL